MGFTTIVKFNKEIKLEDIVVMAIYGEFNKTTGHCNIYYNVILIDKIKENKEEVQKQIDDFKEELKETVVNEGFLYTI
ncbi:(p)ppGpp synthetase I, SpoT/RelA [Clostridium botulinum B str. Osaka05]|uniref:(P)ppGpp synthetase I, SpoT/RelA n=1 Tax=Clostridium botulinum B str. Osaka05 TaxID=1407017 RepID=A0A060N5P3_CLOBO|nr:hypothetical protein [Clostridium botulinum]BAO04875.1 (p)ppGpp synthetase I, SpoT/RelA [Clostridium botulinum B str. Osaka05]